MGQPLMAGRAGIAVFLGAVVLVLVATAIVVWATGRSPGGSEGLTGLVRTFADSQPPAADGVYRAPTSTEFERLTQVARAVAEGRIEEAREAAGQLGLSVVAFRDEASGRDLYVVRESSANPRGWGMLVVDPSAPTDLVVEVPHPVDDRWSDDLAARTFISAGARALVVAGASREALPEGASDVAHRPDSAFEAMHRGLLASGATVMQIHGYDAASRDASYGDAVLSSGTDEPGLLVEGLADILRAAGIDVCVYDGDRCSGLGAVTNVQGASALEADVPFVHVEVSERLREDERSRERVARSLAEVLGQGTSSGADIGG